MSDVDERTIGDLTVRIDRLLCVGFGDCIDLAPTTFELDDDGIAVFGEEADTTSRDVLLEACDACPVDALTVLDGEGEQLVP